ncbi:MAG: hypothetical protein R3A10_10850 [Caldilineaceae bacterium]
MQTGAAMVTWGGLALLAVLLPVSVGTRRALAGGRVAALLRRHLRIADALQGERTHGVGHGRGGGHQHANHDGQHRCAAGGRRRHFADRRAGGDPGDLRAALSLAGAPAATSRRPADTPIDLRRLWQELRPFYWLSLADVLLHRLDIILLNIVTTDLVTGIYSIAYSVVRVGVKLIQSFWQALYPTLSRLHRQRGSNTPPSPGSACATG